MPRKSKDSDGVGLSLGKITTAAIRASMPIGRLMRKIQCQLAASISQPPRMGPAMGPMSIGTPNTAITRPIRSGPAARVMIVMPSGISMPPPRPCNTRKAMSEVMSQAKLHSTEPRTNSTSAVM